ncbi:hypothetical protein GCM10027089_10180 [Nocardia thraciensis]
MQPIAIRLPAKVLVTSEDTGTVLDSIQELRDVTIAVFHRNPYLHFTLTDEFDGSNFDVMVTRPDQIDIYPGYRATLESLSRVAYRLGERFGASEIGDVQPQEEVRLSELAGVDFP